MHTNMRLGHQDLRKLSNRMHHHLIKVNFLHGNENQNVYDPYFLNTAEHIAPIVNKPDDTGKTAVC